MNRRSSSREYDRQRNQTPARQMATSRRWKVAAKAFLAEPGNHICRHCKTAPATMVDHARAHKGDSALFWDRRNWLPSCGPCNSRKAAQAEGGFGNQRRPFLARAKGADVNGLPLDPNHPWNRPA